MQPLPTVSVPLPVTTPQTALASLIAPTPMLGRLPLQQVGASIPYAELNPNLYRSRGAYSNSGQVSGQLSVTGNANTFMSALLFSQGTSSSSSTYSPFFLTQLMAQDDSPEGQRVLQTLQLISGQTGEPRGRVPVLDNPVADFAKEFAQAAKQNMEGGVASRTLQGLGEAISQKASNTANNTGKATTSEKAAPHSNISNTSLSIARAMSAYTHAGFGFNEAPVEEAEAV